MLNASPSVAVGGRRGEIQARSDEMMVEFIGAAGAGKSFLSDRILEALKGEGMAAIDFDLIEIDKVSPRNAFLVARAFFLTVMTKQKTLFRFRHTFNTIARFSIRREVSGRDDSIYITSEGLIHRIMTIHRNSSGLGVGQLAEMLYQRIRPPDVIVVIEVSAKTAFARRNARNRPNDVFTHESVKADVDIIRESIDVIMQIKRTFHTPMQIVRVSTEQQGAEDAIAEVIAAIERTNSG